jgi:hypothetical protein
MEIPVERMSGGSQIGRRIGCACGQGSLAAETDNINDFNADGVFGRDTAQPFSHHGELPLQCHNAAIIGLPRNNPEFVSA